MRSANRVLAAISLAATAAAGAVLSNHGTAQTMYPHIYGISNLGETCSGYCYAGVNSGQYLCCGVTQAPK